MPTVPSNNVAKPQGQQPSESELLMALAIMNNLGRVKPKPTTPKDVERNERQILQGTNPKAIEDIDDLEKQGKMREELSTAKPEDKDI